MNAPSAECAHTAPEIALGTLTARVAQELQSLATLSAKLQLALSLCSFAGHTDAEAIRGLQGIDRVTQSLEDLARLVHALALRLPENLSAPAAPLLASLQLHELLARIGSTAPYPGVTVPEMEAGDILWF
ncbi:MAG: hypothetical protein K0B00_09620 [Rhodobacteraceae bacterium]|nr:hypothetical protein [Paracoccaceae bacterium]